MHLMYNTNEDALITRAGMMELPAPKSQGPRHHPVPFSDFIDMVGHSLDQNGISVMQEEYAVTKDHGRMFGLMEIAPKHADVLEGEYIPANDWRLMLGLRGSHDQSIARGITLGTQVMVCSNLCFHGDLGTFTTKQTTNIMRRLPMLVASAVEQVPAKMEQQKEMFEAYKNFTMKRWQGDAALVEIHRRGGLSGSQLGKAVAEWDTPSHDEHAQFGHSAWSLLNACTEAVKPTGGRVNMDLVRQRTMISSQYLDGVVAAH
jgi:hypothetical protein